MKEERKETSGLSRRAFLQGASLAAVAAAGMGVVGCAPTSTSSEKGAAESSANASLAGTGSQEVAWAYHSESPVWALEEVGEPTETAQAELVIIGAGGSGMSAAIQAKQLGMEPVVLEKMAVFGGDQVRFALHAEEAPALLAFDFVNWDGRFSKNILAIYEVVGPRRSVSLGV